jgi:hypothetical protein
MLVAIGEALLLLIPLIVGTMVYAHALLASTDVNCAEHGAQDKFGSVDDTAESGAPGRKRRLQRLRRERRLQHSDSSRQPGHFHPTSSPPTWRHL